MKNAVIKTIEYFLPNKIITNEILKIENPEWGMDKVFERSGVKQRHIASNNETALDLARCALKNLLKNSPNIISTIDCLIFCTQSEDYIMPSNCFQIHNEFNFSENVFAFDFNSACSGYIHGLALSNSLIQSNFANNIMLINADTYSKYIHPKDRSARVLFGDGAAVSLITGTTKTSKGILDIVCSTSGSGFDKFIIRAGGCRLPKSSTTSLETINSNGNIHSLENIAMDGMAILAFVNSKVPSQIKHILERNSLKIDDIDLFIFHQASKMVIDSLTKALDLNKDSVFSNISNIGNTVSASLPIAIADAQRLGLIKENSRILISGFGVGLSWGTAIIQY